MILPAAMPVGRSLYTSALAVEAGLAVLIVELLRDSRFVWIGALLILGGIASFVMHIRQTVSRRMPRPPALPRRDWSTWQTHAAFFWLIAAAVIGLALSVGVSNERRLAVMWLYGAAGLVGFLAQIVAGMQGRLVPMYAWYRAFGANGQPPARGANALPSSTFARPIFLLWTAGVPLLALGLPTGNTLMIRLASACLFAAICLGAAYVAHMMRAARSGQP
jgi:hypothetical protein